MRFDDHEETPGDIIFCGNLSISITPILLIRDCIIHQAFDFSHFGFELVGVYTIETLWTIQVTNSDSPQLLILTNLLQLLLHRVLQSHLQSALQYKSHTHEQVNQRQ